MEVGPIGGRTTAPAVDLWRRFAHPTADRRRFDPSLVTDLPEPARRSLTHAIAPGTLLSETALLELL